MIKINSIHNYCKQNGIKSEVIEGENLKIGYRLTDEKAVDFYLSCDDNSFTILGYSNIVVPEKNTVAWEMVNKFNWEYDYGYKIMLNDNGNICIMFSVCYIDTDIAAEYIFKRIDTMLDILADDVLPAVNELPVGGKIDLKYNFTNVEIGDIIKFGKYYQNNSREKEDIEWLVLDEDKDKMLLISKYVLDAKRFHNNYQCSWSNSEIRRWLNWKFLKLAFSNDEISRIIGEEYSSKEHSGKDKVNTNKFSFFSDIALCDDDSNDDIICDRIFLLSKEELEQYFDNVESRKCKPTQYAVDNGLSSISDKNTSVQWWLRSLSYLRHYVVKSYGYTDDDYQADVPCVGVRPAIWIRK